MPPHRQAVSVSGNSKPTLQTMNTVRKFTTFDELKSCENKTVEIASSLKKHNAFEKVIMEIRSVKTNKFNQTKPKC